MAPRWNVAATMNTATDGAFSSERKVRTALGALVRELEAARETELASAAGGLTSRLTHAVSGLHTSWSTLKLLSRAAGRLAISPFANTVSDCVSQSTSLGPELARCPRYQVGERLGTGGMAEVFRGWQVGDVGFERPVAIKRILPTLAHDEWYRARLAEEACILGRLTHPNIVGVVDFLNNGGERLLVLEYVDGPNLRKLIASGPIPPSVTAFLAAELLSGLGHVHHLPDDGSHVLGVVHCDLSPHNILLSWDGAVKIADFGIAKLRDETEVSASRELQGKIRFMSPEQLRRQPLDGRADLFSLGVILWEMLAGERLFAAEQPATAIERVLTDPIPRPSVFRSVPRDLERVVMKLLRRHRDKRFCTAEAAFDALAKCSAGALRGRVELVELLAQRFPLQAAGRRQTRRPTLTPTVTLPPRVAMRPGPLRERGGWWLRQRRWDRQRRRARRLVRRWWPQVALAVACAILMLGLVARAVAR